MQTFLDDLQRALTGEGELVLGTPRDALPDPLGVPVVLTTSGSTTGKGRPVGLTSEAITASARSTHSRLGGPGQWLLTLPHDHIAGLQVCARSLLAGHQPVVRGDHSLHAAISRMENSTRRYTSLVPTQLTRVLTEAGPDLDALTALDAILLGGSAIDPALLSDARSAGLNIITTYGSTETSGGCVYDGFPLDGVEIMIGDDERIWISGPPLALGYLDEGPSDFRDVDGTRWFRTSDLGNIDSSGRLTVAARADDVIISGGVNVHPVTVENTIREIEAIADCVLVGVPSTEWGQEIIAVVSPSSPDALSGADHGAERTTLLAHIRDYVKHTHDVACAPRGLVITTRLPTRGPGKLDRRAALDLALTVIGAGESTHVE